MTILKNPAGPDCPNREVWSRPETLRALGRLVAGVAHDYNNLLGVVNNNATQVLAMPNLPPLALEAVQRITAAGERAVNLTRQLLLFSEQQPLQQQLLDWETLLMEIAPTLHRLAGSGVRLHVAALTTPIRLEADPMMLEQLLAVLVANARDAMPGGGGLELEVNEVTFTPEQTNGHSGMRSGDFLCLSVRDEGTGIAESVLPRICEPFFTTHGAEQRTGLGLAVALGIVRMHQGWIEFISKSGQGTEVRVYLPSRQGISGAQSPVSSSASPFRGEETILLIEDDDLLRETTAAVLKQSGYRVLQAEDGAAAEETWHWHAERIVLVVSDVVLPHGVSGIQLVEKFHAERPDLKVICTSGFSHEMMGRLSTPQPGMVFLAKPVHPPVLLKTMRNLLDAKAR
jgi:CheY-like chemotaxis protein